MPPRLPRRRRSVGLLVAVLMVCWVLFRIWQDRQEGEVPAALTPGSYDVTYVVDGDTFRLSNGAVVRLIGVDTPEMGDPPEPWAAQATLFTKEFLGGGKVDLQLDRERIDLYGRFLAYAYVGDRMLNEALLQAGLARYRKEFNYQERYKRRFRAAQSAAQAADRGLWGND